MQKLSEELRQARAEIETWARLHKADDDSDLGVWQALQTIDKAIKNISEGEQPTTAGAQKDTPESRPAEAMLLDEIKRLRELAGNLALRLWEAA